MKTTSAIVIACAIMSLTEAALTLTSEQRDKLANAKRECMQQTGVELEVVKKLRDGEFPDEPKFKEFLVCLSKKVNFQNEAGEIQKDVIIEKLGTSINDVAKARELTEKCAPTSSSSDALYQFAKCIYESTPDHIIIVQ